MEPVQALKILIVEDDRDLAGLLKLLLEAKLSARLTFAETCAAARQHLSSSGFDLITLDYRLPDGNGLQLLEEIELMENAPPVVMVTGKGDEATAVRAFDSGVSGYVMKDERLAVMLPAVLRRVLALNRAEKALQDSEERYRLIFENTGAATVIVEDDTTITLANTEAAKLYGYSREELEGNRHWTEFVYPEDLEGVMRFHHLRRVDPSAVPKGYQYRLINRRGDVRQVAVFAELLPGTKRSIASLIDIADAKKVPGEQGEENFRALIENSADIITVLDGEGTIRYQSPSVKSQLGYEPEDVNGRSIFDFIHRDDLATAIAAWASSFERPNETSNYIELRLRHKDGSWRYLAGTGRKMLSNPAVRGIILNARDITEQRKAEEALGRFASIVDCSEDAILYEELDGTIVSWNEGATKLYGYLAGEAIGHNVSMLMPPQASDEIARILAGIAHGERFDQYDTVRITKDGRLINVSVAISPVKDATGRVVGASSVARDITERRMAELALQQSEALYRTLVSTSPEAITAADLAGNITFASDQTAKIHGFTKPQELLGKPAFDLIAPEDRERAAANMRKTSDGGKVESIEYMLLRRDGSVFEGELSASVVFDAEGQPGGFIAVTRDITERKKSEEALRRANAELEAFGGTVSHDLRGPLANVKIASKTLMEMLAVPLTDQTRAAAIQVADALGKSSERCMSLVEALLSLAEAGQAPRAVADIDVREVVERVLEERIASLEEKKIRVRIALDLGTVVADYTHVYQIFANLIGNAIQHNDSPMPEIEVLHVGDGDRGNHWYIVRDNGSGIPAEFIDKIFVPFFRGMPAGTGIGLAIVEKIIQVYGGTIRAYNDGGACFEFVLKDFEAQDR